MFEINSMYFRGLCADTQVICVKTDEPSWWEEGKTYRVVESNETVGLFDDEGDFRTACSSTEFELKTSQEDIIPLRNVKIKLVDDAGVFDAELSKAFQEAVFESGGCWSARVKVCKIDEFHSLYVDDSGYISHMRGGDTDCHLLFKDNEEQEIEFKYTRKLEYTVRKVDSKKTELLKSKQELEQKLEEIEIALKQF